MDKPLESGMSMSSKSKYYLIVTPFFPSADNWRGAFIYDQVKALRKTGKNVVVFLPTSGPDGLYTYEGITVFTFHNRETPSYFFNGFFNRYNAKRFLKRMADLDIHPENVEIIHCHTGSLGVYGEAVKRLNPNAKFLIQHHDRDPYQIRNGIFASWRPNLRYRAKNSIRLFARADYHICISKWVRNNLLEFPNHDPQEIFAPYLEKLKLAKGLKAPEGMKTVTLYNGVDTELFYPLNKPKQGFTIGCIGNFVDLKDHISIIKSVEILKDKGINDLKVVFVGTGPTLNDCQNYVLAHGLSEIIEFRTEVSHEKLLDFYNSLDLFVLPSVFEGFGCVYTEAAACGVPFICCEGQGPAEYISDDESEYWLTEPYNDELLAEKILEQYRNRRKQSLIKPLDINVLIADFVKNI